MVVMTEHIIMCHQQLLFAAHTRQAGKNLARWLVNETDSVKLELEQYSKDFLAFWKDQRAVYWQQVAAAKQAFDNEQKKSDGVRSLLLLAVNTHCE
jgi:hypothetical protein